MSIGLGGICSLYVFSVIFTYWLLTRGFLTPKTSLNKATLWGNVQIGIIKKICIIFQLDGMVQP